jgi:hypothetical protein
VQGLVDAAAPLQQRREEPPGPQLGDLHLDVTGGGRHRFRSLAVAVHRALAAALIAASADSGGGFGLDELLQPGADQLGEHRAGVSGLQSIDLGEQGRMAHPNTGNDTPGTITPRHPELHHARNLAGWASPGAHCRVRNRHRFRGALTAQSSICTGGIAPTC